MGETISIFLNADDKNLTKSLERAKKNLASFEKTAVKSGKGLGTYGKSAGAATNTTLEFSRVVQDAPFGLRGVANNVQQLTANFGNLSKQLGGSRAALKAMIASLSGPAGILLAVSAITAGLQIYQESLRKSTKATNELLDATKELIGGAKSQLTTIQSLLAVARDQNRASDERQRALNKINELSRGYTKSLTLENLETSKSIGIIDKYSEALIRQAKIKGLQNRISELFAKQFELENKALTEQISFTEALGVSLLGVVKGQKNYQTALAGVSKAQENQTESLKGTNTEIDLLRTKLGQLVGADVAADGIFSSSKIKSSADNFVRSATEAIQGVKAQLTPVLLETQNALSVVPTFSKFQEDEARIKLHLLRVQDLMESFRDQSANLINNSISNTFSQLGNAIGQAIGSGENVLRAAGQAILGSLGQFLSQLGGMMIRYGVAAAAYSKASKALLNPLTAGKAAAALIVAGAVLKAVGGGISGAVRSGGGSRSFSGSTSGVGGASENTRRSSSITSFSADRSGGKQQVVFIQRGEELYGVLQSYVTRNQGLGTNLSLG